MRNLKVLTAYRGTNYHGFQRQNNALTVQAVLEKAVSKVLNEPVTIIGCSRTDTGVHANEFCFNVKTESNIRNIGFCRGVNGELPDDISILSCEDVPLDFHARYNAKGKRYIYRVLNRMERDPFYVGRALHYKYDIDVELLNKASKAYIGSHDFTSFCTLDNREKGDFVRTIYDFSVVRKGDIVEFSVEGNGFLYNMVRIMVGTLLDINSGKIEKGSIPDIIESRSRLSAGITAKAHGLYLGEVYY